MRRVGQLFFCAEVVPVKFGTIWSAAAAVFASSLLVAVGGCVWYSRKSGGEKQQLTTTPQSTTGSQLQPHSAMPWGTFPERIPQPGAGYGSPRQLKSQTAMASGMCPLPGAGCGSPRRLESQTAMATGMCPKPCSSHGSPSQFGSQASMASGMRLKTGSSLSSSRQIQSQASLAPGDACETGFFSWFLTPRCVSGLDGAEGECKTKILLQFSTSICIGVTRASGVKEARRLR